MTTDEFENKYVDVLEYKEHGRLMYWIGVSHSSVIWLIVTGATYLFLVW